MYHTAEVMDLTPLILRYNEELPGIPTDGNVSAPAVKQSKPALESQLPGCNGSLHLWAQFFRRILQHFPFPTPQEHFFTFFDPHFDVFFPGILHHHNQVQIQLSDNDDEGQSNDTAHATNLDDVENNTVEFCELFQRHNLPANLGTDLGQKVN